MLNKDKWPTNIFPWTGIKNSNKRNNSSRRTTSANISPRPVREVPVTFVDQDKSFIFIAGDEASNVRARALASKVNVGDGDKTSEQTHRAWACPNVLRDLIADLWLHKTVPKRVRTLTARIWHRFVYSKFVFVSVSRESLRLEHKCRSTTTW